MSVLAKIGESPYHPMHPCIHAAMQSCNHASMPPFPQSSKPIIPKCFFVFFQKCLQLCAINYKIQSSPNGEVSERLKEHAWKACVLETVPWVRIPPSPVRLYFMGNKMNNTACDSANNEGSGSLAIKNCELCQDRKVAAISRPLYVFGISRASFFIEIK